ncbi:MAG TPA: proteasome accessory factor PafA2 family protein [Patescibacteria group bacterium]|nr:proteasome accessory factor PafA2 family protein [Patescibacteria group bacterium]
MSLDMWQGAEQEFAAGSEPIGLFEALGDRGVFVFRPSNNIPRAYLMNGGVCYVHSNLFEVCTPECRNSRELVAYEKAMEAYARLASWALEEETGNQVHLYKTNIASDLKEEVRYTTVGAHENYLVKRAPLVDQMDKLVPYLVLRQLLFGVGGYVDGSYMISPRAIFPKKVYSETSTDYPIMSTRDEPHADEDYFRVHVVNGEGARSEYTTFLKFSLTSYVLRALQEGHIRRMPKLEDPIGANLELSRNLAGDWEVQLSDGRSIGAVDFLKAYYIDGIERMFSSTGADERDTEALDEAKWVLGKLEGGFLEDLDTSLEWRIKYSLIEEGLTENFHIEDGLDDVVARETAAYQYTAVTDPFFEELVERRGIKRVVSEEEVINAFSNPPRESRAGLRVALARRFENDLDTLSWSYLKLRKGFRRISYNFESLEGWDESAIDRAVEDVESLLRSE